uniref:UPF0057-domain-containing protein n=1 Tax=Rhabditophanes sp. KR3021 TaxID=114890 RepID=A0AC35U472_9BILA
MAEGCCANCFLFIVYCFCPCLAVLMDRGCTDAFWINVLCWILGIIPSYIHGAWVIWFQEKPHHHHVHTQYVTHQIHTHIPPPAQYVVRETVVHQPIVPHHQHHQHHHHHREVIDCAPPQYIIPQQPANTLIVTKH